MIKTTFDSSFDLQAAVPAGAKVGILGCSSCASVYRTGDTEKIQEVSDLLKDHCDIILATSIDSPCDQRVLRYLARTFPRFSEVEHFVVLACEAGARSLGGIVSAKVVSPVKTHAFSIRSLDGKSRQACLFCDECHFPDKSHQCPVAACPVAKSDGPCQSRTSDTCIFSEDDVCVWLKVPTVGLLQNTSPETDCQTEEKSVIDDACCAVTDCLPEKPVPLFDKPAKVMPSIPSLEDVDSLIHGEDLSAVFVTPSNDGLSPLVVVYLLKQKMNDVEIGLSLACTDTDLSMRLNTAKACGVKYLLVTEPVSPENALRISTIALIEKVKACDNSFVVLVENSFLHDSDFFLLNAQIKAGADLVFSRFPKGYNEERAKAYASITMKRSEETDGRIGYRIG